MKYQFARLLALIAVLTPMAHALDVTFEPDTRLPIVYMSVAIRGGSAADPRGKSGISRFVAEMLLRGTHSLTKGQIDQKLDQLGAALGVESDTESTVIRGAVLSKNLKPFLALLEDVLVHPSFPPAEMTKLKSETVSQLLELLSNDRALARKRFVRAVLGDHPYSRDSMGIASEVSTFTDGDIHRHYGSMVRDARLLVLGTGDASEAFVQEWATRLGKLRAGGAPAAAIVPPVLPAERRLLIVDKPERTQTQIFVGQVSAHPREARFFPLTLADHVFGGPVFTSRLMKEIRAKRGWSYGVRSSITYESQPRLWAMTYSPANKDTLAALAYGLGMIEELKRDGVTSDEFESSQRALINNAAFLSDTPQKRLSNLLEIKTSQLPADFYKNFAKSLEQVSRDDVNRSIRDFLQPERLQITVLATAADLKDGLMKAAGVTEAQTTVKPYTAE